MTALQNALSAGGLVQVLGSGVYYINSTLIVPSNTQILLGQGVTIRLANNANCNLLRNKHAGVTLTAGAFVRASNVVTVTEPGHPRAVGDKVLIKNLATDTSFNGLVTVASVSVGSWTYSSTGSNGSPTGYGYLTPADNTLAAANFVRASNVVTVTETGHTRLVGDSVYIDNLATDTSFNGTYQVTGVSGSTWTYASTGSNGSPTGTGVVCGDNNISLSGGAWDGNGSNQSGAASHASVSSCFGIILGNVGHINVNSTSHLNQIKYCLWIYNATDINIFGPYFSTSSDCIHFEGPGDRLNVSQVFGNSGDDVVAFTNTNGASAGSYLGFASPSGLGNFGVAKVEGIFPSNSGAPALVKVAGDASTSFKYLAINELNGTLSSAGLHGVALVDDTASLTGMTIGEVVIRNMYLTGGSTSSLLLNLNKSGTIGKIRLENVYWSGAHLGNYAVMVQSATTALKRLEVIGWKNDTALAAGYQAFLCTGTVQSLLIDGFEVNTQTTGVFFNQNGGTITDAVVRNGVANGVTKAGYFFTQSNSASIGRLTFDSITCNANDSLFRQSNTPTLTDLMINNVQLVGTNLGVNSVGSFTVNANCFKADSGIGNKLFQVNSGTIRINMKNCAAPAGKVILFNTGGSVISYTNSDAAAGIDMGNPAATLAGETPQAGDLHWNINATTAGLYGYTNAGAWTKLF